MMKHKSVLRRNKKKNENNRKELCIIGLKKKNVENGLTSQAAQ